MDTTASFYPVPAGSTSTGISYYDWIAAVALQALTTKGLDVKADRAMSDEDRDLELATRAYRLADAMLRARATAAANQAKRNAAPSTPEPRPVRSPTRV
ncbi:MAG: hypothetical protein ACYC3X_05990 [Pirellulaceae bacterium]